MSAINWSHGDGDNSEVVMATLGKKQGANKKDWTNIKVRSRLCKAALFSQFWSLVESLSPPEVPPTITRLRSAKGGSQVSYYDCKRSAADYAKAREIMLGLPAFNGWVVNNPQWERFFSSCSVQPTQPSGEQL